MLKWTKHKESESVSRTGASRGSGQVATNNTYNSSSNSSNNGTITIMPSKSFSPEHVKHNNNNNNKNDGKPATKTKRSSVKEKDLNSSASRSEASDEASSGGAEAQGPITLDVQLPSGKRTDIIVDYSTPMIDLLVHLAGKSRLSPTGLVLQIFDHDTGKPLTYKPNQAVGALTGRQVRLAPKEDPKAKGKTQDKPFEMTHRFIMNLPRGQKTVVRVSPHITLGQLMTNICEDKSLDLRRHILQIPGQPGVKVDLGTTIQELGMHELNLVAVGLQDPRSHMVSMPDLSQPPPSASHPPSFAPPASEHKKKRGFLSFLSKNKDKKLRTASIETSSTTSYLPRGPSPPQASRQANTPPAERRRLSSGEQIQRVPPNSEHHPGFRPKSMFVSANSSGAPTERQLSDPAQNVQQLQQEHVKKPEQQQDRPVDVTVNTGKKKRRAPAPPSSSSAANPPPAAKPAPPPTVAPSSTDTDTDNTHSSTKTHNGDHVEPVRAPAQDRHQGEEQRLQQQQQAASTRAEILSRLHSRNSSDSSGYHELTLSGAESPEAPGRLDHESPPPQHVAAESRLKTSIDATSIESGPDTGLGVNGDSGVHDLSPPRVSPIEEISEKTEQQSAVKQDTAISVGTAAPVSSPVKKAGSGKGKKKRKAPAPPAPQLAQVVSLPEVSVSEPSAVVTSEDVTDAVDTVDGVGLKLHHHSEDEIADEPKPQESSTPRQENSDTHISVPPLELHNGELKGEKSDHSDEDINEETAFDINDILEGVVFDEEPRSVDLLMAASRGRDMVMEETSSIASESVDQIEVARSERPCSFVPPPPPDEPPPPDVEPVKDLSTLTRGSDTVLVDKGTEVNDDNHSLAPLSAKNSPGTVPASYKNEMALFVERMSKMAVETASGSSSGQLDDSVSSLSIPASDTSETGSVIQHTREDSESLPVQGSLPMSEEISVPVETVPPPPEFDDDSSKGEEKVEKDANDSSESEEEHVTETVEQLIIPLTSQGYDFSAAKRIETETSVTKYKEQPLKMREEEEEDEELKKTHEVHSGRERSGSTGVFRAEPVSIAPTRSPRPPTPPLAGRLTLPSEKIVKPIASKKSVEKKSKEEFVLTTEDLSNVSFLPPKSKMVSVMPVKKTQPLVSEGNVSRASLVFKNQDQPNLGSPRSINTINHSAEEAEESPMENKPISILQYLPTMRARGAGAEKSQAQTKPFPGDSPGTDDSTNDDGDPVTSKLTPKLLVNSHWSHVSSPRHRSSLDHSQEKTVLANTFERKNTTTPISVAKVEAVSSPPTAVTEPGAAVEEHLNESLNDSTSSAELQGALANQYATLQSQFAQWQEQLTKNQTLLADQASLSPAASLSKASAEQLQQLTDQVQAQQQMMQQLQQTMQALQQQQQGMNQVSNKPSPPANEQLPPEPPALPPTPPPAPPVKVSQGMPKVRTLDSPRPPKPTGRQSRFEPVLDPREELMLAIRGFKGRDGLRSVSLNETKWIHSNK